jgi:nucleotide-binding universal stress UspA family protein
MTVLVGYLPTPAGEAAFAAGLAEANRRGEDLFVLNSPRGGALVSQEVAAPERVAELTGRAEASGVRLEVRQGARDGELADELLRVADEMDASVIVIGLRRRSVVGKLLLAATPSGCCWTRPGRCSR